MENKLEEMEYIGKINTLVHAFRILNKSDVVELIVKHKLNVNIEEKYDEIKKQIVNFFRQGELKTEFYEDIRNLAFEPDLEVLDGFFLGFDSSNYKIDNLQYNKTIQDYKESDIFEDSINFNIINSNKENIKILVSANKNQYFYDSVKKSSNIYVIQRKCYVEIYPSKGIVYFRIRNSVIFNNMKTILQKQLRECFTDPSLKLYKPRLSQALNLNMNEKENIKILYKVNPATVKLLDIIFELENKQLNFSGFSVIDIKFDHEEKNEFSLDSRIDSVSINGENLLYHKEVIEKVLDGRIILEVKMLIEYNQTQKNGKSIKHIIEAGINYENKYFRIFINDSDSNLMQSVLSKAYEDLKELFILKYDNNELKNEDKIINMLVGE